MIVVVIVVGVVVIFFIVCFIVFLIEIDVVLECKIVMCCEQIDRGVGCVVIVFKYIVGSGEMIGKFFGCQVMW